jgi:dTDP-4-amino-4,6-dideoxygalactose transaminase
MKVPFVDLTAQYRAIKNEIDKAIASVLEGGQFIKGKAVNQFEKSFADKLGTKHCVAVGNGTDALFVALKAIGITAGDEVLTPALSWISTAETITLAGAKPIFVDVDPGYFTIDLREAQKKITEKTKAIIAVHLYGQMVPVKALKDFCKSNNLLLIEDCAQAHFSKDKDVIAGTLGDAAAFSFYPTKNIGAYGDAGCVVTNKDDVATYARRFSNHGGLTKHEHVLEGINSRMDEMQAAILAVKLKYIDSWNDQRNQKATYYRKHLSTLSAIQLPKEQPEMYHTYHQFVIKAQNRDELKSYLFSKDIFTEINYPTALPFEPAYGYLNYAATDFPVAYELQQSILSLPIYPELSEEAIEYVCTTIHDFYKL